MARIRTIKPEFWTSEQVAECSSSARLLFIGLWNFADDNGIHPAAPMRLKMEVFPGDSFTRQDIESMIAELKAVGLIDEYECNGTAYWIVSGWKHQKIDKPTYKYPLPLGTHESSDSDSRTVAEASSSTRRGNGEDSPPEGKGREGKGNGASRPWDQAVRMGIARSHLGKLAKQYGTDKVDAAILQVIEYQPADPKSYLERILKGSDRSTLDQVMRMAQ